MTKLFGIAMILSGVLVLVAGTLADYAYGNNSQITGNLISNIIDRPDIEMGFFDYVHAISLSYSIISFTMGIIFLLK